MTTHFIDPRPSSGPIWNPLRFLLTLIQVWLDQIEIKTSRQAQWICRLIPSHCPFERTIRFGKHTIHIPSLCQVNPVYENLIALRFRAATFLAEVTP